MNKSSLYKSISNGMFEYFSQVDNLSWNNHVDAEESFINLRDKIISEYRERGFCDCVDKLIYVRPKNISVLQYAAICQITNPIKYEKGSSEYVPVYNGRKITWEMINKQQVIVSFSLEQYLDLVRKTNEAGRKLHLEYLNEAFSTRLVSDSKMKAEIQANKMDVNINQATESIEQVAKTDVNSVNIREAEMDIPSGVVDNSAGEDNSIKCQLLEYQKKYRSKVEQEINLLIDRNQENLSKTEEFHDQMCAKTNELTKSFSTVLDEMVSIKEAFYKHLHTWQKGLYQHEYEQLAERYTDLYKIIDVDKLIINEILKGGTNQQLSLENGESAIIGGEQTDTLAKLKKLDETLHIFLHKFELSLNGLGLYVYRVEEGVPFDYVWHTNVDDSVDCEGKNINRCIVPGIARRVIGDGEDDVIIPALVSV